MLQDVSVGYLIFFPVAAASLLLAGFFLYRNGRGKAKTLVMVRAVFHTLFLAIVLASLARHWNFPEGGTSEQWIFFCSLLASLQALLLIGISKAPGLFGAERPRWLKIIDFGLTNLFLVMLLAEGGLIIASKQMKSPLFWDDCTNLDSARDLIDRFLLKEERHRFNSKGYCDKEFFRAGDSDWVAVLLTDSFGTGRVPYRYNFATVIENTLQSALKDQYERIAVHNLGIAAIGMPEYAYLLENEAMQYNPSMIILCVFVGNDIKGWEKPLIRPRVHLQEWWLWKILYRITAIQSERTQLDSTLDAQKFRDLTESDCDFISDPNLEKPAFLEEHFLHIEKKRARVCLTNNPHVEPDYQSFFSALNFFRTRLGERLLVVLIPDEFQVNDRLYEEIMAQCKKPSLYDRFYPQERIRAYCERNRIDLCDTLLMLRQMEEFERTYHLRDSHWNTLGNYTGGETIGRHILKTRFDIEHEPLSFAEIKQWVKEMRREL